MLTKEDIRLIRNALDKVNQEKCTPEELINFALEKTKGKII